MARWKPAAFLALGAAWILAGCGSPRERSGGSGAGPLRDAQQRSRDILALAAESVEALNALANSELGLGLPAGAEKRLQEATKTDPNDGPALLALGALQTRAGRNSEAEQTYRRLSQLSGEKYKPLHALFLFRSGKREEAVAEFEKLAKDYPWDREARARLVRAYLAANKTPEAERILTEALKKNGRDADALVERSKIQLADGRLEAAQAGLNQAIRLQPANAEAHYTLSKLHLARGNAGTRQQELNETLRLNPRHLPARLELARQFIEDKAARSALYALEEAPADQKKTLPVLIQRNWALAALGDNKALREGIDEALAQSRDPEVLVQDGALKLEEDNISGARASLEEALQAAPENLRALNLLVRSYAAQKQEAAGLRKAREYASRAPQSARMQQFLGELLLANRDRRGARQAFQSAKAASPGFAPADVSLAELDMAEGRLETARKSLSAQLAVNPRNVPALLALAGLEDRAGNYAAAAERYRTVLEQDPANQAALNNLAYLLAERANQPDAALKYAQQAKEINPDDPAVDDALGWIYYRKGIYLSAVRQLEIAVQKDGSALRRYHLAMAYLKAGDYKRGQQTLDAALKMDAGLPEAQAARQLLADVARGIR